MIKNLNIFKDSNVLVTGHTGFKGSWLTLILKELGANVTGISLNNPSTPSHFKIIKIKNLINDFRFNICDIDKINQTIKQAKPDFIFHLAAQALLPLSYKKPIDTWNSNLGGTINILQSIKNINNPCIAIFITSDKCYLNVEKNNGYKETDNLGGLDPYSASKASADIAIQSYVSSFFPKNGKIRIGIGRAGNVIGGGDWAEKRLVPDCIRAWSKNKTVNLRSTTSTRPWQHVLEPLSGYLNLAISLSHSNNLHGEAFNFGPSLRNNYPVKVLVEKMGKMWGNGKYTLERNKIKNYESKLLQLNCGKARVKLNWKSSWNFDNTVKETLDWYKLFYSNDKKLVSKYSAIQINNFFSNFKKHGLQWK